MFFPYSFAVSFHAGRASDPAGPPAPPAPPAATGRNRLASRVQPLKLRIAALAGATVTL